MKNNILIYFLLIFGCFSLNSCQSIQQEVIKLIGGSSKDSESGKKSGLIKNHRKDGSLMSEVEYVDGKRHGLAKDYYESGELHAEIPYINGEKHGEAIWYFKEGGIYQTTPYVNGMKEGIRKKYHRNKKLMAEIPFQKDHLGKGLKEWDEKGEPSNKHENLGIRFTAENRLKQSGEYILKMHIDGHKRVKFYTGELVEGKWLHKDLAEIKTKNGVGEYIFRGSAGSFLSRNMNFIAEVSTTLGNPYVIEQKKTVNVSN